LLYSKDNVQAANPMVIASMKKVIYKLLYFLDFFGQLYVFQERPENSQ